MNNAATDGRSISISEWVAQHPWLLSGVAVAVFIFALMGIAVFLRRKKIEDPVRLTKFLEAVQALDWSAQGADRSLEALSRAVTQLVQAEIEYYYATRAGRRLTSQMFRTCAFTFGTLGLVCPLVEAAVPLAVGLAKAGYILLALAAASFAGNELFGGTRGHIRSVSTQYKLESLLTTFVLTQSEWLYARSQPGAENSRSSEAFQAVKLFCKQVYEAIEAETKEWGSAIVAAEDSYRSGLKRPKQ